MKSGILAIHKPEGLSSARVVARVKKALGVPKVGHTGTLDPFATGLLLCAVNKGTRISQFFLGGHKAYQTRIRLGVETDTYDLTGQIVSEASKSVLAAIRKEDILSVVESFKGAQLQSPPAFSALKHKGQPLYKLARKGEIIEKPARPIEIFDIRVTGIRMPEVDLDIFCSAGTYIRSLGFDIGRNLGCGAHLSALCRTRSSQFSLEDAVELDVLEDLSPAAAENRIVSLSDALPFLPKMVAGPELAQKIRFGQKLSDIEIDPLPGEDRRTETPGHIRVVDETGELLAIITPDKNSRTYNYSCVFSG